MYEKFMWFIDTINVNIQNIIHREKHKNLFFLQLVYQQHFDTISNICENEDIQDKTICASYATSYLIRYKKCFTIVKHSRPFSDDVFLKN